MIFIGVSPLLPLLPLSSKSAGRRMAINSGAPVDTRIANNGKTGATRATWATPDALIVHHALYAGGWTVQLPADLLLFTALKRNTADAATLKYSASGTYRPLAGDCGDVREPAKYLHGNTAGNFGAITVTPHTSSRCPLPAATIVRVDLGDGTDGYVGPAGEFDWGPGLGPDGEGRIHQYEPLTPATTTTTTTAPRAVRTLAHPGKTSTRARTHRLRAGCEGLIHLSASADRLNH